MLYREIIAVCSQIHTKLINTLCGQNVELLNVSRLDNPFFLCHPQDRSSRSLNPLFLVSVNARLLLLYDIYEFIKIQHSPIINLALKAVHVSETWLRTYLQQLVRRPLNNLISRYADRSRQSPEGLLVQVDAILLRVDVIRNISPLTPAASTCDVQRFNFYTVKMETIWPAHLVRRLGKEWLGDQCMLWRRD